MLNNEIEYLQGLNIGALVEDLNKALELQKERASLDDLKKEKNRKKAKTASEIEDDYNKTQATIKANEEKKMSISMEIGGINSRIDALNKQIEIKNNELVDYSKSLAQLAGDNALIVERAKEEYQNIVSGMSFKQALAQYEERYSTEESSYNTLSETLIAKQYAYINKFNSH